MSIRWTKRPQNFCGSCGYSWYPRGKSVSAECPRCHSTATTTWLGALLGLVGAIAMLPLLPIVLLVRAAVAVAGLLLRLLALALRLVGLSLARVAPAAGRVIGAGASGAAGVAARSFPAARDVAGGVTARLARRAYRLIAMSVRWVASAKDDLYSDSVEDREVNPLALVAKLLIFATACSGAIILAVNAVLFAAGLVRSG